MPAAAAGDIQNMPRRFDLSGMLNNPVQRGHILVGGTLFTHEGNWRKINLNVAILGKMTKLSVCKQSGVEKSSNDFI